jgi:micrococcal nuclease
MATNIKKRNTLAVLAIVAAMGGGVGFLSPRQERIARERLPALTETGAVSVTAPIKERRILLGDGIRVVDGDTIHYPWHGIIIKDRLAGCDTPEKGQYGWKAAGNSLQDKLRGQIVTATVLVERDNFYNRGLVILEVNGVDINRQQVREGWAWAYLPPDNAHDYLGDMADAQDKKIGLWNQVGDHIMPREWRRGVRP